jgi:ankyrin repeat protein
VSYPSFSTPPSYFTFLPSSSFSYLPRISFLLSHSSCCGHSHSHSSCVLLYTRSNSFSMKIRIYLLGKSANPNTSDDGGWTPLMSAASAGHVQVAKLLIDRGADVHFKTEAGRTPLHYVFLFPTPILPFSHLFIFPLCSSGQGNIDVHDISLLCTSSSLPHPLPNKK